MTSFTWPTSLRHAGTPDVRGRHVEVPWRLIGDFRNLAVHNCFSAEWPLVWAMARSDVPQLLGQVTAILAEHYPGALALLDEPSVSDGAELPDAT